MQIAVDPPAWVRLAGAKTGKTADIDHGQTIVLGREIGIGRVQAEAGGADAYVLGGKSFREAVPSKPEFRQEGGREHVRKGERDHLHPRGNDGVVAGQDVAAGNGEGSALIAVSEVVAAGQQVVFADVLINFRD